jgi:hypothetical protein
MTLLGKHTADNIYPNLTIRNDVCTRGNYRRKRNIREKLSNDCRSYDFKNVDINFVRIVFLALLHSL